MLKDYLMPSTIESALFMLKDKAGKAKLIAGGTDLTLQEPNATDKAEVLIDLSMIPDLKKIEIKDSYLSIGAAVTHTEAANSELVKKHAMALSTACSKVGGKQIRNMGTVGGNIITALPAADAAVAFSALDAKCLVRSCCGKSELVDLAKMYAGIGKSTLDNKNQILAEILIPLCASNCGTSFQRMEQRKALSLPMLCVAAKVEIKDDIINYAALAVAPVGVGPTRMPEVEDFLKGKKIGKETFEEAAELSSQYATFRSSAVRGSKEFRETVLPVFIVQALEEASSRAMENKE